MPASTTNPAGTAATAETLVKEISTQSFRSWYNQQRMTEHIRNGNYGLIERTDPKPAGRMTASGLLRCHRRAWYRRSNAPREGTRPTGLFWTGNQFEEELLVPYLDELIENEDLYIQNGVWIETAIERSETTVQVRGMTDPAIVRRDGRPLVLTELKTVADITDRGKPRTAHRAQLQAYIRGAKPDDGPAPAGLLLYMDRETFAVSVSLVTEDTVFWSETVEPWISDQHRLETATGLPPAEPRNPGECRCCDYRHRCGRARTPFEDVGPDGLLPNFPDYDRKTVVSYLNANAEDGAALTPTLANVYPALVPRFGAFAWQCPRCDATVAWDEPDQEITPGEPVYCPDCRKEDTLVTLTGPLPSQQLTDTDAE